MARINTVLLIAQVAINVDRANFVRHDPAVVKAAKQALADGAQAGHAVITLVHETRSSWRRSDKQSR